MADDLHKQDNGAVDGAQSDTEPQLLNVPDSQISMDLNVQSLQGSSEQSPMPLPLQQQNVVPYETFQHQIEDQVSSTMTSPSISPESAWELSLCSLLFDLDYSYHALVF